MNKSRTKRRKINRAFSRYPLEGNAEFTNNLQDKSELVTARLYNICPKGMYFESSTSPGQDSLIYIKIDDLSSYPSDMDLFDEYIGKVRWDKRLNGNSPGYGMGVMILSNVCVLCEEKIDYARIWQIDLHSLLCHKCYHNLKQQQDVKNCQLVEEFLNGNVF